MSETPRRARAERGRERRCRLRAYLIAGDPTVIEWLMGTLGLTWGGWLLRFPVFATAPHLYRYVAETPEAVWGLTFMLLGGLKLPAWHFRWQKIRFFCGVAGAVLWERFGYLTWRGDHRSGALVFLGVLAVAQILGAAWLYGKAFPSPTDKLLGYDKE